jgi:hypothetical protein
MTISAKIFVTSLLFFFIFTLLASIIRELKLPNKVAYIVGEVAAYGFLLSIVGMIVSVLMWIWS